MDEYGVDEKRASRGVQVEAVKISADMATNSKSSTSDVELRCPECWALVEVHGDILRCPKCGTKPFE